MDTQLFTERSLWTMLHGIVLSGAGMMALSAALFSLRTLPANLFPEAAARIQSRHLVWLTGFIAAMLWATVVVGTYIVFPPYRATPPEGVADLTMYPKALLQSSAATAWLHSIAMESKEHIPWIATMLATAAAFIAARYKSRLVGDVKLNNLVTWLLAICLLLVVFAAVMGVFVNKVAPLD